MLGFQELSHKDQNSASFDEMPCLRYTGKVTLQVDNLHHFPPNVFCKVGFVLVLAILVFRLIVGAI